MATVQAMRFYEQTLGGKLELMTFAGWPMAEEMPPGYGDRIMHARLDVAGQTLMASDTGPWAPYEGVKGIEVTLNYPTAAEGKKAYDALSQGGTVKMPLEKTFWAEAFGMFTDRFGTPWMINAGPLMK